MTPGVGILISEGVEAKMVIVYWYNAVEIGLIKYTFRGEDTDIIRVGGGVLMKRNLFESFSLHIFLKASILLL